MPGLAMDPSQVSAIPTQCNHKVKATNDRHALQPFIKDENNNTLSDDDYDEDTYKPRPQIPKPFVVMRSLAHLIKDLETGLIDIDPEYQREVVWTAERMTGLINSLMENFYIPPIILNKKTTSTRTSGTQEGIHVCVDGKQRLSSVRAFIKGMIPCHDHRGEKWWFCDTPTSRRKKILHEDTQEIFLAKEFVSFEFKDLSPEQEEDLFARVQMGVQLSLAEKLRASTGPWQELARLFVDDFPIIYSLMKIRARAKDFQLTLSCFSQIIEVMHPTASDGIPILKTNYNALSKLLSNKGAVDDGIKSHLASVWNTFKNLIEQCPDTFTNAKKYLRGAQTFAPVEMVAVAVLISMYSGTRNIQLLLGDIQTLREAIRENYADIRMNASVWKFVWDFLEDIEAIRGVVDGSAVNRQIEQPVKPSANSAAIIPHMPTTSPPSIVAKRGRPTARTIPHSIIPLQQLFTSKKKEGLSTPSLDTRPPKRPRTNPCHIISPTSVVEHPNGIIISPHFPGSRFTPPPSRLAYFASTQPQFPPMPTRSTVSPITAEPVKSTQLLPRSATQLPDTSPSKRRTNLPWTKGPNHTSTPSASSCPVPVAHTPYTAKSTPPISSEVQQGHVSELHSYRAPTATMTSSTPVPAVQQSLLAHLRSVNLPCATSRNFPPQNAHHQRLLSIGASSFRTGIGAFAPRHTEQQWAGEVRCTTPPNEPAAAAPSSERQSVHKPRRALSHPTPAQNGGTVDLTSDMEQERQDLLSSFKAKALAAKQKHVPATPMVPPHLLHGAAEVRRTVEPDLLARENNSYTRLKNGGDDVRSES